MSEELKKISDMEREVQIVIPWEEADDDFEKQVAAAAGGVSLKGFRAGKVPADVARSHVDTETVLMQVAQTLIGKRYAEIVKDKELKIISEPSLSITKLAQGNAIECTLTLAVMPEDLLPKNWRDAIAKINKEFDGKSVDVAQEDIDKELTRLAQSHAKNADVERAARNGDQAIIDFTVLRENVPIEGGTSKDHTLVLGSNAFIPGFEEQIIDMKKGQEKSFELSFPEKYHSKHLAGQKATFNVTVKNVQERIIPDIDDAFVKSIGKFETRDEFIKSIREGMEKEGGEKIKSEREKKYFDTIIELTDFTLPEMIVQREIGAMFSELEQQLQISGGDLVSYLEQIGKTREEMHEAWKDQAQKRVKSAVILHMISEKLDTSVDDAVIQKEMSAIKQYYETMSEMNKDAVDKDFNEDEMRARVEQQLQNKAVMDALEAL